MCCNLAMIRADTRSFLIWIRNERGIVLEPVCEHVSLVLGA